MKHTQPEKEVTQEIETSKIIEAAENESCFMNAVEDFSRGNTALLNNEELVDKLPRYLLQLFQNENQSKAYLLLDRLGEYILNNKGENKGKVLKAIDVINNFALASQKVAENGNGSDFKRTVHEFRGGEISFLQDQEFVKKLPHHIMLLCEDKEERTANLLLERLGECILRATVANREKALMVFAVVNNLAIASGNIRVIHKNFNLLVRWLECETICLVGYAVICQQLQRIGQVLISNNLQQDVDELLEIICKIEDGSFEKNEIIKNMVSKIREHVVSGKNHDKSVQSQKHLGGIAENTALKGSEITQVGPEFDTILHDFVGGNDSTLHERDFVEKLPHYIFEMYKNGVEPEAMFLLERLGECIQSSNVANREKGLVVIAVLNNLSLASGNLGLMQRLFRLLIQWLETETVFVVGFAVICKQLQRIGLELLRNNFWNEGEELLGVLCRIKQGVLLKNRL